MRFFSKIISIVLFMCVLVSCGGGCGCEDDKITHCYLYDEDYQERIGLKDLIFPEFPLTFGDDHYTLTGSGTGYELLEEEFYSFTQSFYQYISQFGYTMCYVEEPFDPYRDNNGPSIDMVGSIFVHILGEGDTVPGKEYEDFLYFLGEGTGYDTLVFRLLYEYDGLIYDVEIVYRPYTYPSFEYRIAEWTTPIAMMEKPFPSKQ